MRRLVAGAAIVLWLAVGAHAHAQTTEELDALRQRIEHSRERVAAHEAEERNVFARLDAIDRLLADLAESVRGAEVDAERARSALEEIDRETLRLAAALERTRSAMAGRAVALYKSGAMGPLRLLLGSDSLRELLQRMSALQQLLSYDASLLASFERDRSAYQAAREDALQAGERHSAAAERLRSERVVLRSEQAVRRELLERVRVDRRVERELLVALERAARALETTLAELGSAGRRHGDWLDGSGFAARRGELPLPVSAAIVAPFGRVVDREFLTQTVRNGVEFGARRGAVVRATGNAEVRYAGWFRGYGKIVILDHGDSYFTVSGHLSEIHVAVGDRVREGEAVGSAGDTGSLTGLSLYFELRRGSQALDPVPWFSPERLAEAR